MVVHEFKRFALQARMQKDRKVIWRLHVRTWRAVNDTKKSSSHPDLYGEHFRIEVDRTSKKREKCLINGTKIIRDSFLCHKHAYRPRSLWKYRSDSALWMSCDDYSRVLVESRNFFQTRQACSWSFITLRYIRTVAIRRSMNTREKCVTGLNKKPSHERAVIISGFTRHNII